MPRPSNRTSRDLFLCACRENIRRQKSIRTQKSYQQPTKSLPLVSSFRFDQEVLQKLICADSFLCGLVARLLVGEFFIVIFKLHGDALPVVSDRKKRNTKPDCKADGNCRFVFKNGRSLTHSSPPPSIQCKLCLRFFQSKLNRSEELKPEWGQNIPKDKETEKNRQRCDLDQDHLSVRHSCIPLPWGTQSFTRIRELHPAIRVESKT